MKFSRRKFLHLAAGAVAMPAFSRVASAQTYPTRPARLVVGYAAGGANDIAARLIGQWLSQRLGQPFVIENRPGAGTNIATDAVVRASPDGYTLLLANSANAINATLYDKLNFNFVRDITPVAGLIENALVMVVNPSAPANSVPELIAYAKANPNKITMATAGGGSPNHMCGELFKIMTSVNMVNVPYRGAAPAMTDLLGGQVDVLFAGLPGAIEYIRTGKLRALAVTTAKRSETVPEIPTVGDFVAGYDASNWIGLGVPKNTPAGIIDKINTEVNAGLADSNIKMRFADLGGTVLPGSPADFGKLISIETEKWAKVVKLSGAKPD
jgi:tripartite-type tricarboxylate transporter receptor subunit TctC